MRYTDMRAIQEEIARVKRVVAAEGKSFAETFMTAPSPGIVSTTLLNAFYPSQEAYLMHLAGEVAKEYREIVKEGLILQIDAPDLAMDRVMFYQDESEASFVKAFERHVAAINKAIEGLPRDRIRLHVCWGNWEGPHIYDVALAAILPAIYQAKVGALSIEFSNPRHAHEYQTFKRQPFPKDMILVPGVVEFDQQFRRAPRGGRHAHRRGGARGRRPRARDRLHRLRLRHVRRPRMGGAERGVAEAEIAPPGRRARLQAPLGQERGVIPTRHSGAPAVARRAKAWRARNRYSPTVVMDSGSGASRRPGMTSEDEAPIVSLTPLEFSRRSPPWTRS